jgi:hypothetical protein
MWHRTVKSMFRGKQRESSHRQVLVPGLVDVYADEDIAHLLGALNAAGATTRHSCQGSRHCGRADCGCRLAYISFKHRHDAPAAFTTLDTLASEIDDPFARRLLAGELHDRIGEHLPGFEAEYGYEIATNRLDVIHDKHPARMEPGVTLRLPRQHAHLLDRAAGGAAAAPTERRVWGQLVTPTIPEGDTWFPLGRRARDGVTCVAHRERALLITSPDNAPRLYEVIMNAAERSGLSTQELASFLSICETLPALVGPGEAGVTVNAYVCAGENGSWLLKHRAHVSRRPMVYVETGSNVWFGDELDGSGYSFTEHLFGNSI